MSSNEKNHSGSEGRASEAEERYYVRQELRERNQAIAGRVARDLGLLAPLPGAAGPLSVPSAYAADQALQEEKLRDELFDNTRRKRAEADPQLAGQLEQLARVKPETMRAIRQDADVQAAVQAFRSANAAFRDFMDPLAAEVNARRNPPDRSKPIPFADFAMSGDQSQVFSQRLGEMQKAEHDLMNAVQVAALRHGIGDGDIPHAIGAEMIERDVFEHGWRQSQRKAIEERKREANDSGVEYGGPKASLPPPPTLPQLGGGGRSA